RVRVQRRACRAARPARHVARNLTRCDLTRFTERIGAGDAIVVEMEPAPLTSPLYLRPAAPSWLTWLLQRLAAAIAAILGLASFVVVAVTQPTLWATPDWRLTVP